MTQFLTGAPIWVWPLLALLIFVGLRARQERTAPALLIYLLPLLGLLALRSVAALPAGVWVWLVFVLFYGLGACAGHHLQSRWLLDREGRMVQLAGENLTLLVMMIVFWANFAGGVLLAVAPDVYDNSMFQAGFAAILALSAGTFAGRAFRVWRHE
ncbi:MAG: hypothetical protein WA782_13475 [Sulfitobacter sp.]